MLLRAAIVSHQEMPQCFLPCRRHASQLSSRPVVASASDHNLGGDSVLPCELLSAEAARHAVSHVYMIVKENNSSLPHEMEGAEAIGTIVVEPIAGMRFSYQVWHKVKNL